MIENSYRWLSLAQAATHFGYSHPENLRQRLRQLRSRGMVLDMGNPPPKYRVAKKAKEGKIILYWPNPNTALIRSDVPAELFIPKRGKRARN